jgi:hypothetical protein
MRNSFEGFLSRFDSFKFVPSFRASQKVKGISTPVGFLATFAIFIMAIILVTMRY